MSEPSAETHASTQNVMDSSEAKPTKEADRDDGKQEGPASGCDKKIESNAVPSVDAESVLPEENDAASNQADDEDDEAKLKEKLQTLKGDRIGETMFSERFVLSTVLRLPQLTDQQPLETDDDFERDLCNLWDMTIEPDVVRFLLQQEAVELFLALAARSKDYRLVEILIGIVGNMCCVEEMHDLLHRQSDLLLALCDFLAVSDSPTLVQLMRTLTTLFDRSDDERYCWFGVVRRADNLTEKLSLILATSTNRVLLEHTVETISAMINRFTEAEVDYAQLNEFYRLFAKSCLPVGLFEAFRQLYPAPVAARPDSGFEEDALTVTDLKTLRRFMEIHEHFVVNANELYEPHVEELVQCVYRVLVALSGQSMLFPLTKNHVCILVCVNNIYSGIMYHFHADSFITMVRIYGLLVATTSNSGTEPSAGNDRQLRELNGEDVDDGEEFDVETASAELLEAIFFLIGPIDEQIIRRAVQEARFEEPFIEELCRSMCDAMDGEPLLHQTCAKLLNAARIRPPPADGATPMVADDGLVAAGTSQTE